MRKLLGLVTLTAVLLAGSQRAAATTYIFATFSGDDVAGMKLSIYTSTDSINFTLLSNTGFGGNTTYIRDPSIMKYTDGKYYIAYTDPMTASCCNPEDHFGIAVSSDLIHWTDLTTVKAGVAGVSRVWAPEWFVEGDGTIRIIANIDTGNELPDFQQYAFTAQDSTLTSWSGPTELGIATNYIDTFIAKLGTTYHAFLKNDGTRYLEHATAQNLTGPWTFVGTGDWAGWGSGLEGPAIVLLDNGQYRMYVDPQAGGVPCQTMTSSDLNTWSARSSIPGTAGTIIRHGTVIRDVTGFGSNGYFTAAGGASGTGGAAATGGSSGSGGVTSSGSNKGGSTGSGGSSPTGGSLSTGGAKGGSTSTGGSLPTGGSAGGANLTGGSIATGGATGSGGGNGVSTSSVGGRGGSGTADATDSIRDAGNTGAGGDTGASTGAAGSTGGSTAAATPDAEISAGGTSSIKDAGIVATGGTVSAAIGGSTSSAGGTLETLSAPDAGGIGSASASGCSCTLTGRSSAATTSAQAWLLFGLAALVVSARRRRRR
ncbi:MAG: MYXO-CTERM sorting domain-containing protein [Polyangia bacterium]